jgi:hypothetical protein
MTYDAFQQGMIHALRHLGIWHVHIWSRGGVTEVSMESDLH